MPQIHNVIMENNRSHNSGANSTLYNVAMKIFPLLSHIFIWNTTFCFAVTKFPYATSIYLSVSANEPGIKSEIYVVMLQVTPDSKIELVGCKLSEKSLLGFLHWKTYVPYTCTYFVTWLHLYCCIMYYIISSIYIYVFYPYLCSSEVSYRKCLVLEKFKWSDYLIHIWSIYLVSNR